MLSDRMGKGIPKFSRFLNPKKNYAPMERNFLALEGISIVWVKQFVQLESVL